MSAVTLETLKRDFEAEREILFGKQRLPWACKRRHRQWVSQFTPEQVILSNLHVEITDDNQSMSISTGSIPGPAVLGDHGDAQKLVRSAFVYVVAKTSGIEAAMLWKLSN